MHDESCPVCGMQVAAGQYALEYHGIRYSFCSGQCRDNFRANPRLYIGRTNAKPLLKRRRFMLDSALADAQAEAVKHSLFGLMGIKEVCIDGRRVEVSYDLLQARASQVGQAIADAGVELGSGWSDRLKRGWLNYTEENELEQLAAEPAACCSRPPAKG